MLKKFHLVSDGIDSTVLVWVAIAALCLLSLGTASYALLSPYEARHAGIVHDMWAGRQYLMPRVDGLPVLDGAPLYYWVSLAFLFVFGVHEWVLRLPSVVSAALTLVFLVRVLSPGLPPPALRTLIVLFLLQPALMVAGRFVSPDMLNILLLTVAAGGFLRAALAVENGCAAPFWNICAWVGTALLGLGAGPIAMAVPLSIVSSWLAIRGRCRVIGALCWCPGLLAIVLLTLPWLWLAAGQYSGVVAHMFKRSVFGLLDYGHYLWTEPTYRLCLIPLAGGGLPLLACLYRYRDPARRLAVRNPVGGFMAVWLAVLVPLHPLVTMTLAGHAAVAVVPLLYFGAQALSPGPRGHGWRDVRAWGLHLALAGAVGAASLCFLSKQVSAILPVTEALGRRYQATTDKVILLDRYDYEFNFYMRSPKLVYVAADWSGADGPAAPPWKKELLESARFAAETSGHLLLDHEEFLRKLCERRVVNLWIIGSEQAAANHPILFDLTALPGTGKVRAWYLATGMDPGQCAGWGQRH